MRDPHDVLSDVFGHAAFRGRQREVIDAVLAGGRVLAVLPTGAGKSLTYQIPAILLDGLTLVVSPLLALMRDQVGGLTARGVRAARLDSSQPGAEQAAVLAAAAAGQLDLLYLSPERLADVATFALLGKLPIACCVVDEAHCYCEWGDSFRPDYLRLPGLVRRLRPRALLCLTATATRTTERTLRKAFAIPAAACLRESPARPNIFYHVRRVAAADRPRLLLERLRAVSGEPAIVYVTRQETAVAVAGALGHGGVAALAYHAGMDAAGRRHVEDEFQAGRCHVLVATIAFGMGIDKGDIRHVIHYNLPRSAEGWLQESGRAGRDGQPAVAEVFACGADLAVLENFALAWVPGVLAVERVLEQILSGRPVSLHDLGATFDLRQEALEHLLVRLELAGHLRIAQRTWKRARITPLRPPASLVNTLPKPLRAAATQLLESSGAIDLQALAGANAALLARFHRVLGEWQAAGDAAVDCWHRLFEVKVLRRPDDLRPLADELAAGFASQAAAAQARLQTVVRLVSQRGCVVRGLLAEFGHRAGACGHCSGCAGGLSLGADSSASAATGALPRGLSRNTNRAGQLPDCEPEAPAAEELAIIQALVRERHAPLRTAAQLARFLCGLRSPAARRARLDKHASFGLLERLPFSSVLAYAQVALGG